MAIALPTFVFNICHQHRCHRWFITNSTLVMESPLAAFWGQGSLGDSDYVTWNTYSNSILEIWKIFWETTQFRKSHEIFQTTIQTRMNRFSSFTFKITLIAQVRANGSYKWKIEKVQIHVQSRINVNGPSLIPNMFANENVPVMSFQKSKDSTFW